MRTYSIAAIPADGIGPEVISAGITVLESLSKRMGSFGLTFKTFDWGSDYYKKHGVMMPADGLAALKKFDAIYFGAVGAPDVPDHIGVFGGFDRDFEVAGSPRQVLDAGRGVGGFVGLRMECVAGRVGLQQRRFSLGRGRLVFA